MTTFNRRYHITTFGCQMNKADSRMAGILEDMGFQWSEDPNDADLILYNTCTIRDNRRFIPTWVDKRKQQSKPDAGSRWLRRSAGRRSAARRVPELDLVMGPQHANRLHFIEQVFDGNQVVATEPIHIVEDITKPRTYSTVTSWV